MEGQPPQLSAEQSLAGSYLWSLVPLG